MKTHEPHCPVPRAAKREEGAVCLCGPVALPEAVEQRDACLFIPLPRKMWVASPGGACCCGKCDGGGFYDTLAVSGDHVWTVHYPELQLRLRWQDQR